MTFVFRMRQVHGTLSLLIASGKSFRGVILLVLLYLLPSGGSAQTVPDSAKQVVAADSIKTSASGSVVVTDSTERKHSIRKATILSALLPGAGQYYNKKYWKIPVIYAAFAGLGYLIHFNNEYYHKYDDALIARLDDDPATVDDTYINKYSDENLRTLSDYYHRNRDLSIVFTGIVYALNIIDAHVDAHLYSFDISDDLSMQVQPTLINSYYSGMLVSKPGLGLSLKF